MKKLFLKFRNIHSKPPAPEPLFNKVSGHTISTEHLRVPSSGKNVPAKFETKIVPFEATTFSLQIELLTNLCKSKVYSSKISL